MYTINQHTTDEDAARLIASMARRSEIQRRAREEESMRLRGDPDAGRERPSTGRAPGDRDWP
jgi:hypothetical protein